MPIDQRFPSAGSDYTVANLTFATGVTTSVERAGSIASREWPLSAQPRRSPALQGRTGVHPSRPLSLRAGNGSSCPEADLRTGVPSGHRDPTRSSSGRPWQ